MNPLPLAALLLLLGLLSGCDEPAAPETAAETRPETALEPEPVTAASPPAAPAAETEPAAARPVQPRGQGTPGNRPRPAAAAAAPLPALPLDLSLPESLVSQLEFGRPLDAPAEARPLLPPLFIEKSNEPGPYQISGRLITDDQVDDYFDSVQGAELHIEFRN